MSCRQTLPLDAFGPDKRATLRTTSACRRCIARKNRKRYAADREARLLIARARYTPELGRSVRLRTRYHMTGDEYDALLAAQGNACAVCGSTTARHVDHDHDTGLVRGVLCLTCNVGLGMFGDDAARLTAAAAYLLRTTSRSDTA